MFKKILIANRGVIGARIVRTCREMGIEAVALYTATDRASLHVRLADQCHELASAAQYSEPDTILAIARAYEVDAIHPGYGFLAEESGFIKLCEEAGITFIGPPAAVVETLRNKIATQEIAAAAGFRTPQHSRTSYADEDFELIAAEADDLGYPLIIKSCSAGRGRGERLATLRRHLPEAVRQAQAVGRALYGDRRVYLEKAILPAYQVGVQIVADGQGTVMHLGDREGSVLQKGQKVVEEAPAHCLNENQRRELHQTALDLARLFNYQNVGTVEFLVDENGHHYFSEIKARIQVEHPLTEILTRVDLVREQIRLAAGEPLDLNQEELQPRGWAMMCRVRASDPLRGFLPSPGPLARVRLPGGPEVRADTYVYCGCNVPGEFDPLLAVLTVWAPSREQCLQRLERSLQDFKIVGTPTNLPLLQQIARTPEFAEGAYDTTFRVDLFQQGMAAQASEELRDLAAAMAVLYVRRNQLFVPQAAQRLQGGWHQASRQLPR